MQDERYVVPLSHDEALHVPVDPDSKTFKVYLVYFLRKPNLVASTFPFTVHVVFHRCKLAEHVACFQVANMKGSLIEKMGRKERDGERLSSPVVP